MLFRSQKLAATDARLRPWLLRGGAAAAGGAHGSCTVVDGGAHGSCSVPDDVHCSDVVLGSAGYTVFFVSVRTTMYTMYVRIDFCLLVLVFFMI